MAVGSRKCLWFNKDDDDLNIVYSFETLFQYKLCTFLPVHGCWLS
jgi:hypothetical protein